jgi:hypothetical protein
MGAVCDIKQRLRLLLLAVVLVAVRLLRLHTGQSQCVRQGGGSLAWHTTSVTTR